MSHSDESLIIEFLARFPGSYVSMVEVSKRAGGRTRFQAEPHWARPVLLRLEKEGVLESDPYGHVRLTPGAAALRKYGSKSHRKRLPAEKIKTYVLNMTGADDDKPFPQMLREIVTHSFRKDDPGPDTESSP